MRLLASLFYTAHSGADKDRSHSIRYTGRMVRSSFCAKQQNIALPHLLLFCTKRRVRCAVRATQILPSLCTQGRASGWYLISLNYALLSRLAQRVRTWQLQLHMIFR